MKGQTTNLLKRKPPALIKLELIRAGGKDWERGPTQTYFFLIVHKDENTKRSMCYIVIANLITPSTHSNIVAWPGVAWQGWAGRGKVRHCSEAGLGRAGCG